MGSTLRRLHRNVCNVIRHYHPEYYSNAASTGQKRSSPESLTARLHLLGDVLTSVGREENLELQQLLDKSKSGYQNGESLPLAADGESENWPDDGFISGESRAHIEN